MPKAIGPNFSNELGRAGLIGLPFSWDPSGNLHFDAAMSEPQIAAVEGVYEAHDPAVPDPSAEAGKLLAAGLAITSAATPALNGTYGTMPPDETIVTGLQVAVAMNVFPGFLRDKAGVRHAMTPVQFTAIATALLGFIVAIDEARTAALEGGTWTAPPAVANLA